jgi:hypothetical protein
MIDVVLACELEEARTKTDTPWAMIGLNKPKNDAGNKIESLSKEYFKK